MHFRLKENGFPRRFATLEGAALRGEDSTAPIPKRGHDAKPGLVKAKYMCYNIAWKFCSYNYYMSDFIQLRKAGALFAEVFIQGRRTPHAWSA